MASDSLEINESALEDRGKEAATWASHPNIMADELLAFRQSFRELVVEEHDGQGNWLLMLKDDKNLQWSLEWDIDWIVEVLRLTLRLRPDLPLVLDDWENVHAALAADGFELRGCFARLHEQICDLLAFNVAEQLMNSEAERTKLGSVPRPPFTDVQLARTRAIVEAEPELDQRSIMRTLRSQPEGGFRPTTLTKILAYLKEEG